MHPFAELPEVRELVRIEKPLPVQAQCCLEIFSGLGILSLALVFSRLPTIKPWDTLNGPQFDVLQFGHLIIQLVLLGHLFYVHLAPPANPFP